MGGSSSTHHDSSHVKIGGMAFSILNFFWLVVVQSSSVALMTNPVDSFNNPHQTNLSPHRWTIPHQTINISEKVTLPSFKQSEAGDRPDALCPPPVLERLSQHPVASGETIESIAALYDLIPATLIGFNPQLASGRVAPGTQIVIPPYNGIRVNVPSGFTWQDLADRYGVRADVLFEANGCGDVPAYAFIPGINWSPTAEIGTTQPQASELEGYPLSAIAPVLRLYGWQPEPGSATIEFHSGIDLDVPVGTSVLSVGDGVVAFVGEQGSYGKLIVINHDQGLQTRYAQLSTMLVSQGETIRAGQEIGTTGDTGGVYAPHLHFEIRSNSNLGWIAQDPALYLEQMRSFE